MPTLERRITSTVNTIPALTALAGTVTSQPDTKVLIYEGSDDIATIFNQGYLAINGPYYIYCSSGTPAMARVIGAYQIGTELWQLQLQTAMVGATADPCSYVFANLIGYSFKNDGGANITANGVAIEDGESITQAPLAPSGIRNIFQDAVLIDPASSNVLVVENS